MVRFEPQGVLGCAIPLAIVLGLVAFGLTFLSDDLTITGQLLIAVGAAVVTFLVSGYLVIQDRWEHRVAMRRVRERLAAKSDQDDRAFCDEVLPVEAQFATAVRRQIAKFFDVPPEKIHASDTLEEYYIDVFQTDLPSGVIGSVIPELSEEQQERLLLNMPNASEMTVAEFVMLANVFVVELRDEISGNQS